jgi:hypothetical protein
MSSDSSIPPSPVSGKLHDAGYKAAEGGNPISVGKGELTFSDPNDVLQNLREGNEIKFTYKFPGGDSKTFKITVTGKPAVIENIKGMADAGKARAMLAKYLGVGFNAAAATLGTNPSNLTYDYADASNPKVLAKNTKDDKDVDVSGQKVEKGKIKTNVALVKYLGKWTEDTQWKKMMEKMVRVMGGALPPPEEAEDEGDSSIDISADKDEGDLPLRTEDDDVTITRLPSE